ncbi:hemin uptake protein HemP [Ferrovibrio sp.]|uniref:hemin uptake protein HemP n=1 Tax=Ferrovibrio sp. TaxID=1917215 RepID=UPI001B6E4BCE|nr:hemin uptake protein HemP [Ferrovibrio sp.]
MVSRADPASRADSLPRLDARRLFAATREVIIEHEGADYRLRLTANGKLILTK